MNELAVLSRIAVRNLFANFLNIVIGLIILAGTVLFVVGGSLLKSIDTAMSRSIIGSIAGNIQVYSAKSKDELSLYDNWTSADISPIPDFAPIKSALLGLDNVKAVVPMGIEGAEVMFGNTVDLTLEKLRKAVNEKLRGNRSAELSARVESLKSHVRQIIEVIKVDYNKLTVLALAESIITFIREHT